MFNKTNLVLGLVQGFYWMASCLFISFMVRLLHGYGYDDYQIGITLTFASLASVVIQPLAGRIADRIGSVKKLLVAGLLSAVIGAIGLNMFSHYTMAVYLLIPLIFGVFRSLIYIIDLWSLSVGRLYKNVSYGFTRSFGAVFYAASAVFYGSAIDRYGTNIIIPFFCLFSATAVAMTLLIKTPKDTEKTLSRSESISIGKAVKLLLTNKAYIGLLISYTLVEMSCISHQNYLTRKFEVLGAGDFYTGLSLLVMGLLQLFPLLLNTRLTSRFSPSFLMMICLAGLNLRTLILAFSTTPIGTMCAFPYRALRLRAVHRHHPILHEQHSSRKHQVSWHDDVCSSDRRHRRHDRKLSCRIHLESVRYPAHDEVPRPSRHARPHRVLCSLCHPSL